jgi:hypothetical protein
VEASTFVSELIETDDISDLVSAHLFDAVPHIFEGDAALWRAWKTALATDLDVDAHSVVLVGSAAVGVSLNPNKNLKPFDAVSDVDVAVISYRHFESAWHTLRSLKPTTLLRMSRAAQIDIREHAPKYVYFGSIATERNLAALQFGPRWAEAIAAAQRRCPTTDRDLKIRLYRDVEALRRYQMRSIRMTRDQAAHTEGAQ